MTKPTNNPAPHAGEKSIDQPRDGQIPGMAKPPSEVDETQDEERPGEQPRVRQNPGPVTRSTVGNSKRPSFSSTTDDPLATAGTGGSEDPKGRVRPGGGVVPADSDEFERRKKALDEADRKR